MLSGTGYFKSIDCPFFLSGLCERPYCHFLHRHRLSFSPEPSPEPQAVDAKGHRLYLPPPNAPIYNPTPKALLQAENKKKPVKPYIPSSLSKAAALSQKPIHRPQSCSQVKPPLIKPKEVLGDIGDLSSSDEEKNPDVIGSILLQGVKSGVLGGEVSEFQHELIKNTLKAKNKPKPPPPEDPKNDDDVVIVISDDEESLKEAQRLKDVEEEERRKRILEEERLEAKRILEEKEKELKELEKKRKVLENFYKKSSVSEGPSSGQEKESKHSKRKRKHKSRKQKRSKRKYSRKKSKRRRSSSFSSCSSSTTSSDSSSSSFSSGSSSESDSDSEDDHRRRRKKRSRNKKSRRRHSRDKKQHHDIKREKIELKENIASIKTEKLEDNLNPAAIILPPSAIKQEKKLDLKIKDEPQEDMEGVNNHLIEDKIPSPSQIKDEDLPESVKSFLDAMDEIDSKQTSSSHRSSSEHKKHKSSRSESRRSSSSSSHHHSSSKSSRKSSHRDRHDSVKSDSKAKSSHRSSKSSSSSSGSSKSKHTEEKPSSSLKPPISEDLPSSQIDSNFIESEDNIANFEDSNNESEDVFENQDEELRRIFEEHERQVRETPSIPKKKAQPSSEQSQNSNKGVDDLNPKSKKRVAHKMDSSDTSTSRPPISRRPMSATQQMLERFKKIQSMRDNLEIENRLASLEEGEASTSKMKNKRIISVPKRTVATTSKGIARVSHVPTVDISKPLIAPDMSSKVPSGIRQRYLDSIVDECLTIYGGDKGDAYARATKEEQLCCDRSKNRNIYLNVVVNCIKKLRTEASQASKSSKQTPSQPQRNRVTSHLQILAGKGGSKGSWSIEKPKSSFDENSPGLAYAILKRYALSNEQQIENGYPMMDPEVKGRAFINQNAQYSNRKPQPPEEDKRRCDRCSALYKVDVDGKQLETVECIYHWGRLYRQRVNRALGPTSGYYCCNGDSNSDGCEVSHTHITDMEEYNNMRGFVSTFSAPFNEDESSQGGIYALDCEMCYTTHGNELTRVTVINYQGDTVYESLVKPPRDIIDYNTRFSGISAKDLEGVSTSIRDVQAVLLSMFSLQTILIGHSLESDLKALKMVHANVVDTSIVFPHKMGPPYKRSLKHLAAEHLKRIIQNDVGGHDSAEDALAALDLMKVKVKSDVKKLQQDSLKAK